MTDNVDWPAVREAYEAGVEPVAAIRARYSLTVGQLRWRRERDGWRTRRPVAPAPPVWPGVRTASLVRRLTAIVAAQVARLEERTMAGDGGHDKDARLVGELAKTLGQLDRLAEASKHKSPKHGAKAARTGGADDDGTDWRALLKAKLDRLHGQGDS